MAGYDLTSSALNGDWGGVADGAGGLAGGFVAGKYGQRAFAPEPGAQLGIYRVRPQVEVTNPLVDPGGLLPPLSKWDAPNFISAEPVYIGNKPLYRVSDGVFDSRTQANVNGAYWADRPAPASEGQWRSAYGVLNEWPNRGSTEGVWVPDGGWGWGGKAAPQASLQSAKEINVFGSTYRYGWIQPGGGYQLVVPNSYTAIPRSNVQLGPTPWRK